MFSNIKYKFGQILEGLLVGVYFMAIWYIFPVKNLATLPKG
jgi:hypothetical protein